VAECCGCNCCAVDVTVAAECRYRWVVRVVEVCKLYSMFNSQISWRGLQDEVGTAVLRRYVTGDFVRMSSLLHVASRKGVWVLCLEQIMILRL
jgi:hypothetical protein